MGTKLSKDTIFFSSDVSRLSTEAYMLSGYKDASPKQSSRYPFFWLGSKLCRFEPHWKLFFSMGPKLYRVTIFFGSHVPNFLEAPSSLVLLFSDLQRTPTCCSNAQDASPEFGLHSVLSTSFLMGPRLCSVTLFFASDVLRLATEASWWFRCARCLTRTLGPLGFQTVSIRSPSNILILSAPMEFYTFWWGPNFMLSPSSLDKIFSDTQRQLLLVRVELFRKMPHQNIRLHKLFLPQVSTE